MHLTPTPLAAFFGVKSPFCPPSDSNGAALAVTAPVVPGQRVGSRSSFLDMCGRPVHRGALVSWGGLRFKVLRIEGGRAYYGDSFSNSVACGLVQVVR